MSLETQQNLEFPTEKKLNVIALTVFLLIISITVYSIMWNVIQHKNIRILQHKNKVLEKENKTYKNKEKLQKQQQQQVEYLQNRTTYLDVVTIEV